MSYVNAPATGLLKVHCCACGAPLLDSISVELGIGPDCRKGFDGGITDAQREACNRLTHHAARASTEGRVEEVRRLAEEIRALGLAGLADKIKERFVNAEKNVKITIAVSDGMMMVDTPYKRSAGEDFKSAWRAIPGRRWRNGVNVVPVSSKPQLWALLKQFFPGEFGSGPNGTFRVPGEKPNKKKGKNAATAA